MTLNDITSAALRRPGEAGAALFLPGLQETSGTGAPSILGAVVTALGIALLVALAVLLVVVTVLVDRKTGRRGTPPQMPGQATARVQGQ